MSELHGLLNTTVNGGLEARVLVIEVTEKEKVPPVLEVTLRDVGVTCKFEFGAATMVPGLVTVMLTEAVLPPFFLTDTDPVLALIELPAHVPTGGTMGGEPEPDTPQGLSSKWEKPPGTTADVTTSAVGLIAVVVTAAGV